MFNLNAVVYVDYLSTKPLYCEREREMMVTLPVELSCGMGHVQVQVHLHVPYVKVTNTSYLRTRPRNVSVSANLRDAPHTEQMFSVCFTVKGHSCQHTKGQLPSNKRERAITKPTESIAKLR